MAWLLLFSMLLAPQPGLTQTNNAKAKKPVVVDAPVSMPLIDSNECLETGRVSSTFFKVPKTYDQFFNKQMDVKSLVDSDTKRLRVAYFSPNVPNSRQRGTVVIIMGRAEYIEHYCDVIGYLRALRYGVLIYDLRGQGMSDRIMNKTEPHFYDKGYVEDYKDYVNDHELLMANFTSSLIRPIYLIGHSLGGQIALQVMLREKKYLDADKKYRSPYKKMVVLAPMWQLHHQWAIRPILFTMGSLAGKNAFFPSEGPYRPGTFFLNKKTHSRERFYRYHAMITKNKSLRLGGVTYQWLRATLASNDELWDTVVTKDALSTNTIPLLVVNAAGDQIVNAQAASQMATHIGLSKTINLSNNKHALLQEDTPRLQNLFDIMIDFFNEKQ